LKKIYSISLNDSLVEALDQYCLRLGLTRSEVISKLLIDKINNGYNPKEIEEDEICKRKQELLSTIFDFNYSIPEFKDFTSRFDLELKKVEDNLSILFESSNKKFLCEIKLLEDAIKINARYKSSSSKMYEIFENAFERHKNELEEQGFKREIYQRFWDIEYRHQVDKYPNGDNIKLLARFVIQKLLILYTNFFIEFDFLIDKNYVEEVVEKTGKLKDGSENVTVVKPPYLQVLIGARRGRKYPIASKTNTKIGRYKTEINLTEQELNSEIPVVSNQHVEVFWRKGRLYLIDLGSTNGTSLNGKVISEPDKKKRKKYELMDGDRILIADIELRLFL